MTAVRLAARAVSDRWREVGPSYRGGRPPSEVAKLLLAGKTVFIPLNGKPENNVRCRITNAARSQGKRGNTRIVEIKGTVGIVGWLTDR